MKRLANCLIGFVIISAIILTPSFAAEEKGNSLQGIEFLTGFGMAKLRQQGNYHIVPFLVDFDFNLKPLSSKIGINPPGLLQFIIEPFVSYVFDPHNNVEVGNNFVFKLGLLPEGKTFQPYVKGGVGLIYLTQHYRQQATQFNFTEFAGLGMHWFFTKNLALTVEYRFRHISNADIKSPNLGIETNIGLCGISYLF